MQKIWPLPPNEELQRKLRAEQRNQQGLQTIRDTFETARFGGGSAGILSGGGDRTASGLSNYLVPAGGIIMWSGNIASIPAGWYLCDGNNGTPDLRDQFIVGAKQDDSGTAKTNLTGALTQTGGSINYTPAGTVSVSIADHPADVTGQASAGAQASGATLNTLTQRAHTHTTPALAHVVTSQTFSGTATTIKPPYYALAFIQKS